jgi:hypothetical protein
VFGVAVVFRGALAATPEAKRVLSTLEEYCVPHVILSRTPTNGGFNKLIVRFGLPAQCIWYVTNGSSKSVQAALASGLNVIWVGGPESSVETRERGLHVVASVGEALDLLGEPYTRSVLALRDLLTWPKDE